MWYYRSFSECDIQNHEWNNQMTHGLCLCVCCMCSVIREEMCKKSNYVCHAFDGLEGEMENVML